MTREEEQLLFSDLSARLPYGVMVDYDGYDHVLDSVVADGTVHVINIIDNVCDISEVKPYLRPMSSISSLISAKEWSSLSGIDLIDWYNANHIDYRGLIEKGLALPAPEGMYYETKEEKK